MKLALVSDAFDSTNGWGLYSGEIARGLIARGVDVRLCSPWRHCAMDDLRAHGDRVDIPSFQHGVRHFAKLAALTAPPLRRAFEGVDAVHVMVEPYAPVSAALARRRPLVVSLVGTYARPSTRPWAEAAALRWAMRRACRLSAISAYTAEVVRHDTGLAHTTVVPLAVRASDYAMVIPPKREPGLILSVGEIKPRKGYDLVIEALPAVRAEVPNARYVMVGAFRDTSPYVRQLRARIAALGLNHAVTFAGLVPQAEKVAWYHRAAVVAMPYREVHGDFEGFGLVLLEAGACGTPTVTTRDSGGSEPVIHDFNGLLIDRAAPAPVAEAIARVLAQSDLADRLGAGGRQRAAEMTWERTTQQMLDVYADVLGRRMELMPTP